MHIKRKQEYDAPSSFNGGGGSRSKKRSRSANRPSSTLLVADLHAATTSDHLKTFFENFGDVTVARVVSQPQQQQQGQGQGQGQLYGYVTFEAQEIAEGVVLAAASKDGIRMGNRKIRVTRVSGPLPEVDASVWKPQARSDPRKRRRHNGPFRQYRSRLFLSAVASAVASAAPATVIQRPFVEEVPLPNREMISYDDWL